MPGNKIQNVDLSALNGLSPEERKLAIEMLKEIADTGKSELLEKMKYGDFEEIPVDIHTFLHDRKYLGNGLYDQDGRFTLFPYWEETLKKIFPDNITTAYNTLILTGSIGIGKSTCAVVCQLYMLYRLLCLKDPYLYYGMQPIDKITISLMNITIENAKGVALDKLNQLILSSDWFMSHGEMHGTTNMIFVPDKHIEFVCASSNNQIIGRALFCNFSDEVNFDARSANVERQKARLKQIISQVDARMASRFLRGDFLPTLNIIASSKASDQSFLDDYIETKRRGESKTTLIIDEPQWVVDSRKQTGKWFKVAVGDRYLPNELIPEGVDAETYRAKGYTRIIDVPSGYLEKFKDNIELALTDIAGISTASATKYISGISWNAIKADYENPFIKEIIEVGNSPDDHAQYANFFDLSKVPNEWKSRPMWIHLDMSSGSLGKGDKTGIAGVWIKGKRPSVEGEDITREMYYRVAFSVSIKAPKGFSISFMKHRNFIRWLRDQGFAIKGISCDTWGGPQMQQELKADGFDVKTVSVDRVDSKTHQQNQYAYFKTTMTDMRLDVYKKCDFLTEEVLGLERLSDGHIEHPDAGKSGSKDQIDAVVGALWNASQNAEEYAYNYGDNINAALDVSLTSSSEKDKQQLVIDYQEELKKIYFDTYKELDEADLEKKRKQKEEYEYLKDISDGIFYFG